MINLVLGAVSCIRIVPRLQVHRFVLKDGVCHNKIVGHTQVQQPGAIVMLDACQTYCVALIMRDACVAWITLDAFQQHKTGVALMQVDACQNHRVTLIC